MSERTLHIIPTRIKPFKGLIRNIRLSHYFLLINSATVGAILTIATFWFIGFMGGVPYQVGSQRIKSGTPQNVKLQMIKRAAANYRLRIDYPNGKTKSFTYTQAGLSLNANSSLQTVERKVLFPRSLVWWRPVSVRLTFTVNQAQLLNFIDHQATEIISQPTNASISLGKGKVTIKEAKEGKEYGLLQAVNTISRHIGALNSRPLKLVSLPISPAITNDNAKKTSAKISRIMHEQIRILVGGQTIIPSGADLGGILNLVPNSQKGTISVAVNTSAAQDYINKLAYEHDQVERDRVVIAPANGSSDIAVIGQNGVYIYNQQAAEKSIEQKLLQGNDFSVSLPAATTPYQTIMASDWSHWVEVNLTTKRMYVYEQASTVRTFSVSAGKPSTPTPTGTFYIWDKFISQTMYGPGYVQPDVPWVNYFDHSGDAIHGNYWRPTSVFGSVNTSHGCVGLEDADAQWFYSWAPVGTVVVIHY